LTERDPVRAQYEAYPYPAREPKDERRRLITGSPSHPLEIDHYLFAGRRDWAQPFRALVAGGGTGDGTIMLAQGLADRNCPAEILYLDLSTASRRIAEARAADRGLTNIRFETGSLLEAPSFGQFDYIDCCGVLHHLADPAAGFNALAAALAPHGGLGLMLYGELGRTGVYPMQAALRALGAGLPDAERVALAKRLLKDLPASNWLRHNPHLADHLNNDAGLYDLLLHAQDRAYRVPEIYALLAGAGLRLVTFIEPMRYAPETWLTDPALKRRAAALDGPARAALAEELQGSLKQHAFYAVHAANEADTVAPLSPSAVPVFREMDGKALARGMTTAARISTEFGGVKPSFALPPLAAAVLERIDGEADLTAIHASLPGTPSFESFFAQFAELYRILNGINRVLLRFPAQNR
jgi:SAM-dependent methyltransferase